MPFGEGSPGIILTGMPNAPMTGASPGRHQHPLRTKGEARRPHALLSGLSAFANSQIDPRSAYGGHSGLVSLTVSSSRLTPEQTLRGTQSLYCAVVGATRSS